MKYLKKYKIFESGITQEITEDIEDIFIDLIDKGLVEVKIVKSLISSSYYIKIFNKEKEPKYSFESQEELFIEYKDIEYYLKRVIKYLKLNKIEIKKISLLTLQEFLLFYNNNKKVEYDIELGKYKTTSKRNRIVLDYIIDNNNGDVEIFFNTKLKKGYKDIWKNKLKIKNLIIEIK